MGEKNLSDRLRDLGRTLSQIMGHQGKELTTTIPIKFG